VISYDIKVEEPMTDLLIRNVAPEILAVIDLKAQAMGISRAEYVKRTLEQELVHGRPSVTEAHLKDLLELLPDLANEEIMSKAWQ
jgi:hypothetical protein